MTQHIDWRELRRELLISPPRPRTSKTFQHNDIFSSNRVQDSPQHVTILRTAKEQPCFMTPKKVRETDSIRSHILTKSDVKNEHPAYPLGKRVFDKQSTIFQELPLKKYQTNPHRIPDHSDECFYSYQSEQITKPKQSEQKTIFKSNHKDLSPPRQRKQEELFSTEVAKTQLLKPDGSKLNLLPRSKSQYNVTNNDCDRSYNGDVGPTQRRLRHNKSNLFETAEPATKSRIFSKKSSLSQSQVNSSEVNKIKRINHNFSDVFGLEYGARESLQEKKQQVRNLSPTLKWTNVDSILNKKDIGSKNKAKAQLNMSRSRVSDQKSTLDTHDHYDKPLPKSQKLITHQPNITRSLVKNNNGQKTKIK